MSRWLGVGLCAMGLGVLAALAACSSSSAEEAAPGSDPVIGGVDATGAQWNAIGSLNRRSASGRVWSFCTGTLISPTVVLTARHCAMEDHTTAGAPTHTDTGTVYFSIGYAPAQAVRSVKAKSVTPADVYRGGYTGLGSDVAIYTLSEPITDIEPLKVATNPPKDAGVQYIAIGYGVQNAQGQSQTRKMGKVTLRTADGKPAHLAFGSVDAYVAAVDEFNPAPMTPEQIESARKGYDRPLSLDYEALTGATNPGDVQICNGDSGGPLLRQENGKLVVYGVASTTMGKTGLLCKNGSMHALFGANTRQMIARAIGETCYPESGGLTCVNGAVPPRSCPAVEAEHDPDAGAADQELEACVSNKCCAETTACLGDPECSALRSCFTACSEAAAAATADGGAPPAEADGGPTPAQQCANECYQARPQVYARYLGFTACVRTQCSVPAADGAAADGGQ